jgi:hypothetical protein
MSESNDGSHGAAWERPGSDLTAADSTIDAR